ncbi:FAD binding domain-containing protein [Actinocrispum wychmicini]|uniref:Xanthine dehydrogenase YagS FAD-binding subunit n=1 Tax=Actinocrispum wychmicini TaxID=1213861 RepID=A0A4R2K796_9PSEU|nr:xanthine dehydrogenase family protein subunit M [Actinocrispum wychmicini]TCO65819.1 xanthine dehydrogenase YagS FAD-binding subunit [Actinocrispum wychmicini]
MKTFTYSRATTVEDALAALGEPGTRLMAGGTEMVNWLKEGIEQPDRLVDITALPLTGIATDSGLRVGALTTMSELLDRTTVDYPVLAESLLRAASPQLRNMATVGGNLQQRTRCPYFRSDTKVPCNKREPGSGCSALAGDTSGQAIFGWSEHCVATHPSDLAVALAALDASIEVRGPRGERTIPATEFHLLPGDHPERHTALEPDELIVAVHVPAPAPRSHYLKVRERVSYEFAVVSAAAVVSLDGTVIDAARIALGGVAHRPWRLTAAESALRGVSVNDKEAIAQAIAESFVDAKPLADNGYKVTLAQRAAVRALMTAGGAR